MQSICLNIGLLPECGLTITNHMIEESCKFTCMNLPYGDVVRILKAVPPTRGQQRLRYRLSDGSNRDIYSLILKVLADNPPLIELEIEELMERIRNNVSDQIIKPQKVKDSLKTGRKYWSPWAAYTRYWSGKMIRFMCWIICFCFISDGN